MPWGWVLWLVLCTAEATVVARVGGKLTEVKQGLPELCQPPVCSLWESPLLFTFDWL